MELSIGRVVFSLSFYVYLVKFVETYNEFNNDKIHVKISNNFVNLIFMNQNEN